ncbi:unnamed protein product [Darwinula stevensoni]|uniref:Fibronectin type-III domain-containing protein n=1 Tax=Darwinula stevensoni TaxID=69355 RepID=A0A7R8XDV0_9CRUS|nr:unnamed protein product [Darwinula stevensoni]CAG0888963.1 unnamed protein product [Darwinula stevensoni]
MAPRSPPKQVRAKYLSGTSLAIWWLKPEITMQATYYCRRNHDLKLTAYKVYYTRNPEQEIKDWSSQLVASFSEGNYRRYATLETFTLLSGLAPLTIYTVRVQAYTTNGPTPLSSPLQVKTQYRVVRDDPRDVPLAYQRPCPAVNHIRTFQGFLLWAFMGSSA